MKSLPAALLPAVLVCALRASAQDSASLQQKYEQAQQALSQGRFAEAQQAYEDLARSNSGIAEIHANLGLIYFQQKKFEQAVPEMQRALKLKPGLTKTGTLLAISQSELGRYGDALNGLQKGFRQPGNPETVRICGLQLLRAYTGLRRDREAVKVALELERLYPNDPEVLYQDSRIFGNFAFLDMQKLSSVAPESIWRYQAAAEAFESQGANTEALAQYRKVLAIEPSRPGIHYRMGRTLLARANSTNSRDDEAAAEQEFRAELDVDPLNASAAYEVADTCRRTGRLDEAQQFFERALRSYPDFEEAQVGLAATLIALHRPEQALPLLQKAVALNPEDDAAWFHLVQVYRATGDVNARERAIAQVRRLRENQQRQGLQLAEPLGEVTKQSVDPDQP